MTTVVMDQSRSVRRTTTEGPQAIKESGMPGASGTLHAKRQDQQ